MIRKYFLAVLFALDFLVPVSLCFAGDLPVAVPLENRVARLEAEVAKLQVDLFLLRSRLPVATAPKAAPVQQFTYKQVCTPEGCTWVKTPVQSTSFSQRVVNTAVCMNCDECGTDCPCIGGGSLCSPGGCPVTASQVGSAGFASFGTVGMASSPRTGLFSGIQERRATRQANRAGFFGFCASCQ